MGAPALFEDVHHVAGDVAAPAEFGAQPDVHVAGDVGAPAEFALHATPPEPLGAPATFEAHASVAGDVAQPAPFDDVAPVQARGPLPAAKVLTPSGGTPRRARVWPFFVALAVVGVVPYAMWMTRPKPRPPVVITPPPEPPKVYAKLDTPLPLPSSVETFEPLPPFPQQVVIRGSNTLKVALTFDLCSTTKFVGWDTRITDILERYEVPATLFLGGRFIRERPDAVKLFAENPLFDLQSHTYLHPHLPEVTPQRVVAELLQTDQALFDVVGRRATLFRPPFGEYSVDTVKAATRAGYLPIQFDVASGDPDPNFHALRLTLSVLTQVQGGSIVVLHANQHGVHTAEALALIIESLRERGYQLTTVGDVLADGPWVTDDGRKGPQRPRPPPPTLAVKTKEPLPADPTEPPQ